MTGSHHHASFTQKKILPFVRKQSWQYVLCIAAAVALVLAMRGFGVDPFRRASDYGYLAVTVVFTFLALLSRPAPPTEPFLSNLRYFRFWLKSLGLGVFILLVVIAVSLWLYAIKRYEWSTGIVNSLTLSSLFCLIWNLVPQAQPPARNLPVKLWVSGPRQSGKTWYLALLVNKMMRPEVRKAKINFRRSERIMDILIMILGKENVPSTSSEEWVRGDTYFEVRVPRDEGISIFTGERVFEISCADPAGEDFQNLGNMMVDKHGVFAAAATSSCFLFIYDAKAKGKRKEMLQYTEQLLEAIIKKMPAKTRKIGQPVAVCIAKCDLVYDEYLAENRDAKRLFVSFFGQECLSRLKNKCRKLGFFAFSSTGVRKDSNSGKMVPACDFAQDGTLKNPQDCNPFGLTEPILWLLARRYSRSK